MINVFKNKKCPKTRQCQTGAKKKNRCRKFIILYKHNILSGGLQVWNFVEDIRIIAELLKCLIRGEIVGAYIYKRGLQY